MTGYNMAQHGVVIFKGGNAGESWDEVSTAIGSILRVSTAIWAELSVDDRWSDFWVLP